MLSHLAPGATLRAPKKHPAAPGHPDSGVVSPVPAGFFPLSSFVILRSLSRMSSDSRPAPTSNNSIPRWPVFAFGAVFMLVLLALPFVITKGIEATKERSHALTLLHAAGLIVDTTRGEVREVKELSELSARFTLSPADAASVRAKLTPVSAPPPDRIEDLRKLSPNRYDWAPAPGAPGPWRTASGVKDGLAWFAILDEGAGVLWIHGSRPAATPTPEQK